MEQQSNNKLDALFQKAAEEYPLKTDNHNWDKVAADLHISPVTLATKKRRTWLYAALLLLLIGGGFFLINSFNKTPSSIHKSNFESAINSKKNNYQKVQIQKTDEQLNQKGQFKKAEIASHQSLNKNQSINRSVALQRNTQSSKNKGYPENKLMPALTHNQVLNQTQISAQPLLPLITDKKADQSGKQKNNKSITSINKDVLKNSSETNKTNNVDKKESTHIKLRPQPKTFYGTLFFSPDFSTIKFQHLNKPGYTVGIALGYRINSRLSAEIGLQRIHTNFYSDGKYFDKSNLKLKSTTIIESVNGNNKLTEVPVTIKYNVLKNSDHYFVSAGTAIAMLSHNEKYDYNVTRDGSPDNISRNFNALTGTKYFSTINLSIGYQSPVSNFFKIKVEPYYQAPLKGFGIGKLPISTFGVNIGIVKDLK